jgi:hypothetical protein
MSRHQLTAQIAYELYVQRGRVHGRQGEDWRAAEAIVAMCLAFATALAEATDQTKPSSESATLEFPGSSPAESPAPSLHERALALLQAAVAETSRSSVAAQLGYKSASTVGRYVRGDRPIGDTLAKRIVSKLTLPALRLAA